METESATVAISLVSEASKAFHSRDWTVLSISLLTLLVFVARRFKLVQLLPSKWVPWATGAIAMATSVTIGLQSGEGWPNILLTGVLVGLGAVGAWEYGKPAVTAAGNAVKRVTEHGTRDLPPPPPPTDPAS